MNFRTLKNKFVGDKAFYKRVLSVAIPVMIEEGLTNFVNLLDNLMVGRVGTDQMSGVAIINQLLLVFNLTVFGALAGAGIFISQYHGSGNVQGKRSVFKLKLIIGFVILAVGITVFSLFPEKLIGLYLHEGGDTGSIALTLGYAKDYLKIMCIGLIPYVLTQCCSGTMRETALTVEPMKAGALAVSLNLLLNYLLIFGKFGFPELGVNGAAIATVISRFAECSYIAIYGLSHKEKCPHMRGFLRAKIPLSLAKNVLKKSSALMVNEFLWSGGIAMLAQCYSTRGLAVVAAYNISSMLLNVCNIVYSAMGGSVAIIVGSLLGANKMKEAKDTDNKMIALSVFSAVITSSIMACISPIFPLAYNTTDEVRTIASGLILIFAVFTPFDSFNHAAYFTIRSGGKTFITMMFDCVSVWMFQVSVGFILSRFTSVSIYVLCAACMATVALKTIAGFLLIRSNIWMQNIVSEE